MKLAIPAVFLGGLLVGGAVVGFVPMVRYSYQTVGTELQRTDRWSGRTEWAGEKGWWTMEARMAPVEAEVRRFPDRSRELVRAAKEGRLRRVLVTGRMLTVYVGEADPIEVYAAGERDPRLEELLRTLRNLGVSVEG